MFNIDIDFVCFESCLWRKIMTDKKYYELWKKAVCDRVRQDLSVEFDNNTLLINYLSYIRKCVLYPAKIFESLEVKKEISKSPDLKEYYDEIKKRLCSGKGVAPYLSKQAKKLKPDGLFLDWNILHLHLGKLQSGSEYADRNEETLHIMIIPNNKSVFFIKIGHHKKSVELNPYVDEEELRIIYRNWPCLIKEVSLRDIKIDSPISPDERVELRRGGVMAPTSFKDDEGKDHVVVPSLFFVDSISAIDAEIVDLKLPRLINDIMKTVKKNVDGKYFSEKVNFYYEPSEQCFEFGVVNKNKFDPFIFSFRSTDFWEWAFGSKEKINLSINEDLYQIDKKKRCKMAVESKAMDHIRKVLEQFGNKYFTSDGVLKRNNVIEDLDKYDKDLMIALLNDELLHKAYTSKIAGVEIFEVNKFVDMLKYKEYWSDSFTKFNNKIGLTVGDRYIADSSDVVLDFPYKDTVLKAGMTKEDVDSGNVNELFLNETLAKSEITELTEPKIFVNAKKYDQNGEHETNSFSNQDNLIIKGNNLLGLHSLIQKYAGKIKGVFVDPPYFFNNTKKGDSFRYNSKFKLSTWLTFCKNRFLLAKDLLSDDGIMAISMGVDGYSQLKLILDEIFEVSKDYRRYIGTITWRKTDNQGNIGDFANVIDYILLYRKNSNTKLNKLPLTEKAKKEYSYEDKNGKYRRSNLLDLTRGRYEYKVTTPDGDTLNGPWMIEETEFNKLKVSDKIHWPSKGKQIPYGKIYLSDSVEKGQITSDFWDTSFGTNQRSANEIKKLFGDRVFDFAKPEKLLMNIISLISKKDDVILDFFMGSATTQAVAMKMHRRFIGIEQMDYINSISVPRLKKVIAGEQGGISKDINWQGGGSFVYAELMEKNGGYIRDIKASKTIEEALNVFRRMKETTDFDFRVDLDKFEQGIHDFTSLDDVKRELLHILDKNQLYYNYANIDDANVRDLISDSDYQFNKSFYSSNESGKE